ncbi:MAG: ketopantoate reductase family protein [Enterobacterales bacterium]|nr:ketopantoate reductase family protein [Enterobacterales bacterium]
MQNTNKQQASINIIGAGAIGHLFAAFLNKAKINCRLFSRKPTKTANCQLVSSEHNYYYQQAYHSISEPLTPLAPNCTFVICVKAPNLEAVCRQLSHIDQYQPIILLLMNGMGLVEIANQYFPSSYVLQASTTHGAYLSESEISGAQLKQVNHTGIGQTLIGNPLKANLEISETPYQSRLENLITTLDRALPDALWQANYQPILLQKLIINSVINPLTSLYNVNNGAIVSNKEINLLAYQLTQELAPLIDIYLAQSDWKKIFERIIEVAVATQDNISSMRQDINQTKATEIDYITGFLLSLAKKQDVELSLHRKLYGQIKQLEEKF